MKAIVFCAFLTLLAGVCDGSGPAPVRVSVRQLIETPGQFNGKRISLLAYYAIEHHGPYLCADAATARQGTAGGWRIYPDFENSPLSPEILRRVRPGYAFIVGTFKYRRMNVTKGKDFDYVVPGFGWMNVYDKEITRITNFANAAPASR
jgi:hypothetical protein